MLLPWLSLRWSCAPKGKAFRWSSSWDFFYSKNSKAGESHLDIKVIWPLQMVKRENIYPYPTRHPGVVSDCLDL